MSTKPLRNNKATDPTSPHGEEGYPMRTAVRLTGLGADTLRVWERRYNAVCPGRTSGGGRRIETKTK